MNFYYKKMKRYHDIIFKPRSGVDMDNALGHKVPIYMYSELCKMAQKHGPARMLAHLFRTSDDMVILLQNPKNMDSGHWLSVSRNTPKKEIYFFSTYGGKPDVEKIHWMDDNDLIESGQDINIFNDAMREFQKHGWEIHYNDYPYQIEGDKTATCGIYTVAFLKCGKNPDVFKRETRMIREMGLDPAIVYYEKFFA